MNINDVNLDNIILNTDSYKLSQFKQYPENTEVVFSYIESRGSKVSDNIMMFGLQMFIKKYLEKPITMEDIEFASKFSEAHGEPFNLEGWLYVLNNHGGFLPVKIRAIREGIVIPTHNVMVTVENTDPNCAWLTSYIESAVLRAVWYPSTVATVSFTAKKIIKEYLEQTSDEVESILNFKLHDFGLRGVNSFEGAGIGGLAHLINFMGTDTITGILYGMKYYDADVCGFSIPASEHSTMTSWGKENEADAYDNMINKFASEGSIFAVVSDSYDIYNAVENIWCGELLEKVKDKGATVVIRPDSGDPTQVPIEILEILAKKVGYTTNSKGYKVLPPYVRVIQGDGINIDSIPVILENVKKAGFSTENITFGMGGGLLQHCNRDTFKFAMKCSAAKVNGEWRDVFKQPITDKGKSSKKGRLTLVLENYNDIYAEPVTKRIKEVKESETDLLRTVYENGPVPEAYDTFDHIRERAAKFLK